MVSRVTPPRRVRRLPSFRALEDAGASRRTLASAGEARFRRRMYRHLKTAFFDGNTGMSHSLIVM